METYWCPQDEGGGGMSYDASMTSCCTDRWHWKTRSAPPKSSIGTTWCHIDVIQHHVRHRSVPRKSYMMSCWRLTTLAGADVMSYDIVMTSSWHRMTCFMTLAGGYFMSYDIIMASVTWLMTLAGANCMSYDIVMTSLRRCTNAYFHPLLNYRGIVELEQEPPTRVSVQHSFLPKSKTKAYILCHMR